MRRAPMIYVVTLEPYHDNSTIHFVTIDIDEAFAGAMEAVALRTNEVDLEEAFVVARRNDQDGPMSLRLADTIEIVEMVGLETQRRWTCCVNKDQPHRYLRWRLDYVEEVEKARVKCEKARVKCTVCNGTGEPTDATDELRWCGSCDGKGLERAKESGDDDKFDDNYQHVPKAPTERRDRLIETAEIIMTLATQERS